MSEAVGHLLTEKNLDLGEKQQSERNRTQRCTARRLAEKVLSGFEVVFLFFCSRK